MQSAGRTDGFRQWAALPLRLIVGYGFIAHGYAKVMNGPDRFAASLHALGGSRVTLDGVGDDPFELLGGLAVLVGAWIPLVSVPLVGDSYRCGDYGASSVRIQLDQAS